MRSRIDSRQKEVEKTDKIYDEKVDQIRINSNQKELEIKDKVNQEIARTLDHKQQKLQQFQKELKSDREKLDTERQALGEKQDFKMKSMLTEFDHTYKERFSDAFSKASEINDRTQDTLSRMDADTIQEIQDTNHLSRKRMDVVTKTNEDLIAREQEAYLRTLNKNQAEYATILANEKMRFEKELSGLYTDQADKASTKQEIQAKELQKKEQFFQRLIQQKEIGFKSKIKNLHEQHEVVLDKIKDRFKVEIDKMLTAHSKRKEVIMTKGQDDFYQIRTIQPRVMDGLDHYIVALEVPEHEKDDVNVNVNNREIRITLSRKYADSVVDEQGIENKTKRNEVLTKSIKVDDLMSAKDIRTSYQDGTLFVKVDKA